MKQITYSRDEQYWTEVHGMDVLIVCPSMIDDAENDQSRDSSDAG